MMSEWTLEQWLKIVNYAIEIFGDNGYNRGFKDGIETAIKIQNKTDVSKGGK